MENYYCSNFNGFPPEHAIDYENLQVYNNDYANANLMNHQYNEGIRDSNMYRNHEHNLHYSAFQDARFGGFRREAAVGMFQQYQFLVCSEQQPWQAFESTFCLQSFAVPPQANVKQKRPRMSMQKRLLVNARERERMRVLNKAFESLRDALPCYIADGHMAKITTLRLAINYIRALTDLLNEHGRKEISGEAKTSSETIGEQLFTSILNEPIESENQATTSISDQKTITNNSPDSPNINDFI